MKKSILKLSLASFLTCSLYAGETQIGHGTFEMNGGFIGLNQKISENITTYSILEQHAPLLGSDSWFYKYNFTWYDSDTLKQAQSTINSYANGYLQAPTQITQPSIDYRMQGLDINVAVGKDIYHTSKRDYVGLGLMLGISMPWIDSKKNNNNNDSTSNAAMNAMKDSKTKIFTYKIGPSITARKSIGQNFSIYASGTVAYQNGTFKNDVVNSDLSVNGIFQEYDMGFRFQPTSTDYKIAGITISPRVYATLGYRYTSWDLNDINIDITGQNTKITSTDFNMNSSIIYCGLGYSF